MTRKEHALRRARLAEVARKHDKPAVDYTVYRHGRPAYQRKTKAKGTFVDDLLFVTFVGLSIVLILSL